MVPRPQHPLPAWRPWAPSARPGGAFSWALCAQSISNSSSAYAAIPSEQITAGQAEEHERAEYAAHPREQL
jgi:hypothetical protein